MNWNSRNAKALRASNWRAKTCRAKTWRAKRAKSQLIYRCSMKWMIKKKLQHSQLFWLKWIICTLKRLTAMLKLIAFSLQSGLVHNLVMKKLTTELKRWLT